MSAHAAVRDEKQAVGAMLHAVGRATSREGPGEGWEEERKGRQEGGGGTGNGRGRGESGRRHEARGFGRAGRSSYCDHDQTTS